MIMVVFLTLTVILVQAQREENPNQPCRIVDLSHDCHDESVDHATLNLECEGLHGLPAAKCYMEYLCEHHNQEAVQKHKDCIDVQCPLAKHAPVLDCATWNAANGGAAVDAETSDLNTADNTDTTDNNNDAEATTTEEEEGGGAVPIPGDAANEDDHADETPEEHAAHADEEEDGGGAVPIPEEEREPRGDEEPVETTLEDGNVDANTTELIHEEATVTMTEAQATKETSGGMSGFGKFVLVVFILGSIGGALFVFKNKLFGYAQAGDTPNLTPYANRQLT